MSTIWTPSGERPIRPDEPGSSAGSATPGSPQTTATGGPGPGTGEPTEEEMLAHMAEVERELAGTPAAVVVLNHCMGLFQLAVLHLNQQPPKLEDAQLAIDAMAAITDSLGDRLGEDVKTLREALTQIRMAFVEVKRGAGAG